jgi:ABC-type branched-subunit amino acid transport system substrate-binding protein
VNGRLRIGACLSLSGKYAHFGRQAAQGLETWRTLDGTADVRVEDDRSDRRTLEELLPALAARCDILLGPYSTHLMRTAGRIAADSGWLIWNHGGSGDDVETAHPGHVISVLTPTSRYAEPFLQLIAREPAPSHTMCIVGGPGSFGRQVADGAEAIARQLGIHAIRAASGDRLPPPGASPDWDLFSAGVFEQDAELVSEAQRLSAPPRRICAVAAGVRQFRRITDPEGIFGVGQWFPSSGQDVQLGPAEHEFVAAYADSTGQFPDYPAAQAAAAAVLATHCAKLAGNVSRQSLRAAATELDTSTLFGGFKIDPAIGAQVKHRTVLVRWTRGEPLLEAQLAESPQSLDCPP